MGFFKKILDFFTPRTNFGKIKIIEGNCKRILNEKLTAKGIKEITPSYEEAKNTIEAIFEYFEKFEKEDKVNIEELADCKRLIDQDLYRVLKKNKILTTTSKNKIEKIGKNITKKINYGDRVTPVMIVIFAKHCEKVLELCN